LIRCPAGQQAFLNQKILTVEKSILNSKEAASYLDISLDQLYKLSAAGKLPTYSPTGGKVYFVKSELEDWILSSRRATVSQIKKATILSLTPKFKR